MQHFAAEALCEMLSRVIDAAVLGARVRAARLARDWNQQRLGVASECTTNTIVRLERGVGDPKLSTINAVADALGVSAFWLLCGETAGAEPPEAYVEFLASPMAEVTPPTLLDLLRGIPWPTGFAPSVHDYLAMCGALMGRFSEHRVRQLAESNKTRASRAKPP